ncbi:hypothetical protein M409DRAFT_23767 [Zasmidium cellare ATCC 36951]|uniref:F-box domain-containing protein n=1 Tax=Zasmidium cellare ATCC 36951 TaxID=1080233 RepID=A0A6A6CK04_ZASCE|nr:uncharacterized protein M409DRAFT_23767 [Zasmidium cellare ATCC 36951]KAF2166039.1 hypothetical protein M409DRAFT_23767 [Zasmidium cellare ATCC 36951]
MPEDPDEGASTRFPAGQKLINTFELLEKTLLEKTLLDLDMPTLLRCQRVCKRTKAVIDDSTYLQEALFFRQAPASRATTYGGGGINPLLIFRQQRELLLESSGADPEKSFQFDISVDEKPVRDTFRMGSWRRMAFVHGLPSSKNEICKALKLYTGPEIRKEDYDVESPQGRDEYVRALERRPYLVRLHLRSGSFYWERTSGGIVVRQEHG